MRLRVLVVTAMLVACDRAPVGPDLPEVPAVISVACALGPLPDVVYEGGERPPIDLVWSGSARVEDGSSSVLDSAVVKLGLLTIRRYRGVNAGSTTLAPRETTDGVNNLVVTCHKGARFFTVNEQFELSRRQEARAGPGGPAGDRPSKGRPIAGVRRVGQKKRRPPDSCSSDPLRLSSKPE